MCCAQKLVRRLVESPGRQPSSFAARPRPWDVPWVRRHGSGARQLLRAAVLLGSAACLGECADASKGNGNNQGVQQDQKLQVSGLAPSAVHWALAVMLGIGLAVGLVRVFQVLHKKDGIALVRHAPEGMRPVQCGACLEMQHISLHGRIFICFSCHAANRIANDPSGLMEVQLVASTGPPRLFEFSREGENYFQEMDRREIAEDEAAEFLGGDIVVNGICSASSTTEVQPLGTEAQADGIAVGNNVAPVAGDLEAGTPSPRVMGLPSMDSELISNHSVRSKKSKQSSMSRNGLPDCVVCLEEPGNVVLLPCAHGGVCDGCVIRIAQNRAQGGARCPHCRSVIETLVKIHKVDGNVIQGVELRVPIAQAQLQQMNHNQWGNQ